MSTPPDVPPGSADVVLPVALSEELTMGSPDQPDPGEPPAEPTA